jgi:AcrR family transcriptional regulator
METRQKLMQAAHELIVEAGFDGMTTAAVARRAGVSEGAIYRHFPSKEALADAVFADVWRIFNEYMEGHLPSRERPKERLDAFFRTTLMAFDALMPSYAALCQQEHLHYVAKRRALRGPSAPSAGDAQAASPRPGGAATLPEGALDYVALLEEAIRLAQKDGFVRAEVDPRVAAHFLFFGADKAMEFFGDPHHTVKGVERLPADVFAQLEDLMIHSLSGAHR